MIAFRSMSRFHAAGIHLGISAAIGAATLAVMLGLWYPPPLFWGMGGAQLALLIITVDVAIGPLITLIVFDVRKKELAFDLAVVAVLQLAALSYGIHAMHAGRPAFMVFTGEHMAVVPAAEIAPEELEKAGDPQFRQIGLTGPRLVAAIPPADVEERNSIAFAAFAGLGIQHFPKYYVSYENARDDALKASRPVSDLKLDGRGQEALLQFVRKTRTSLDSLRCLPVKTRRTVLTAILDQNGKLLGILDIDPVL